MVTNIFIFTIMLLYQITGCLKHNSTSYFEILGVTGIKNISNGSISWWRYF